MYQLYYFQKISLCASCCFSFSRPIDVVLEGDRMFLISDNYVERVRFSSTEGSWDSGSSIWWCFFSFVGWCYMSGESHLNQRFPQFRIHRDLSTLLHKLRQRRPWSNNITVCINGIGNMIQLESTFNEATVLDWDHWCLFGRYCFFFGLQRWAWAMGLPSMLLACEPPHSHSISVLPIPTRPFYSWIRAQDSQSVTVNSNPVF